MGTAIDLLKKTQSEFTASTTLGVSEPIDYFHKQEAFSVSTRAFVSSNIYNDLKKNIRITESKFSSLELDYEPTENDEITYDGKIYRVREWEQAIGRYVVYTIHKQHHTGKRVKIR